HRLRQVDLWQHVGRGLQPVALFLFGFLPQDVEADGVELECGTAPHDLRSEVWLAYSLHLDGESESVEELRPEVALLGVHRANEDEFGWVAERDALALDVVHAHCGRV